MKTLIRTSKKHSMIIAILLQMMVNPLSAQVYTPNCTSVDWLVRSAGDVSALDAYMASFIISQSWSVTKIENATQEYNCHAYAWDMIEGGTQKYWINAFTHNDMFLFYEDTFNTTLPSPNNIAKYWADGSYLETIESQATKVYYGSCWQWSTTLNRWKNECDHSAVRITSGANAGKYQSKWGGLWCLFTCL